MTNQELYDKAYMAGYEAGRRYATRKTTFSLRPCSSCRYEKDCSFNWADAFKDRYLNLRDDKDCWTAKDGE